MATTITQKPNLLSAVNTPLIYILTESSSTVYNGFKFRYVLKVEVDGVEIQVLKIHKNQQNVGIFDLSHILKAHCETQLVNQNSTSYSIHTLGIQDAGKVFSQNSGQLAKVTVKAFYEVATSATDDPALSSQQASADSFFIPATTPFTKTATNVGGLDIINVADASFNNFPLTFFMNSTSSEDSCTFFTNAPTVQFVRGSSTSADNLDELTICFKQGDASNGILNQGSKIDNIAIQYFNSAGTLIAGTSGSATVHFFDNTNANGGATSTQSNTVAESILYFGCGTKNLQTQTEDTNARPSNFSDWSYYRIFGCTSNDIANRCTKYYNFYRYGSGATVDDRHQSCTRYDNIRLAWRNRLGAWDYMNFRGRSKESVSIKSEEMSRVVGNWDSATSNTFNYNNWDRGRETLFTEAQRKLTINSDFLNEDEALWLEELFTSVNVQILEDGGIVKPVIITDKLYTKKTSVNDKIKIQYTIKLEYANKVRTNS
tara:strand:+ start:2061 stop:3521 length:1461 start_codon:yes stop_codon:yes gene_type:complete